MQHETNWLLDLEGYIRQGEPERAERSSAWQTAIGLQAVDGLKTSDYLLATAKEHIEGSINISDAQKRIVSYYEQRGVRDSFEEETREADIVASRIAQLIGERTFQFSPAEYQHIHKRLFADIFDHAGQIRDYNISKKEWVLKGASVYYASHDSIRDTLEYDFGIEKNFSYEGISAQEAIRHIAKFTSGIWQIHPFGEGNTRATAVFIIRYLRTFGFQVDNDVFAKHSWYFRNALVRANYNDLKNGVHSTTRFLEYFFDNLLMNGTHELKNRYLHVDYVDYTEESVIQSATSDISKCQNVTLEELALLKLLSEHPAITQKQLAVLSGKSERTIKRYTVFMQEKGFIKRENGKRNGKWMVLVEMDETE